MTNPTITENSAAALVARFLKARGVDRVFGLCGGHIMPIWMRLDAEGIRADRQLYSEFRIRQSGSDSVFTLYEL